MIDIITVVFRDEIPLLKIQARSISQYINQVDNIIVIVNDSDDVADLIDSTWWGPYQTKVTVIPYSYYQYTSRVNGWENQQLLKLLAASNSTSPWSMVLDAKTWFIKTLDFNCLFDDQGRANTGVCGIFSQFSDSQQFVENLYNIKLKRCIGPGGVPFMFHTETVNGLVNSVTDFPEFFQTAARYPTLVTEFHLYSGYVLYRYQTYDTLYSNTYYKALNIAEWEADNFDQLFGFLVNSHNALTASIHRRTYNKLTENQIQQWIDFLKDRALIDNELEIKNIIYTYITQEKNRVPTNLETQNLINTYIK